MKTIKVKYWSEIPKNFTGKAEFEDGDIWYLRDGLFHNETGPAEIYPNSVYYMFDGVPHRIGGPAAIINGKEEYIINDNYVTKQQHDLIYALRLVKNIKDVK